MTADIMECYIVNCNTGDSVIFNIEIPDQITDSYSTAFDDQATRGRSSPFKSYNNSGPRSISFSVTLAIDYRRDIVQTVNCLRDMLKPVPGATSIKPPRVKVRIGTMLDIIAVPMSFDVTWGNGYINSTYRTCECSFAFDEVEDMGTFAQGYGGTMMAVISTTDDGSGTVPVEDKPVIDYEVGGKFTLTVETDGFFSLEEALTGKPEDMTLAIEPGEYTITEKSKGMLRIDAYGLELWINPSGV